jgi:hypothetical protein
MVVGFPNCTNNSVGHDQKYLVSAFSNAQMMVSHVQEDTYIYVNFDIHHQYISLGTQKENIPVGGVVNIE